jgi:hypothetical protein
MCTIRPYEISYSHNSTFTEKNYAHNLSLEEKIYAQVNLKLVVHTNCMHKFCANQTYVKNYVTNSIYRNYGSKLYI